MEYTGTFNFEKHFRTLNADIVLAPLAPVLECAGGYVCFYHLSFAEFLLDSAQSGEYFVHPQAWQQKLVSQLVPAFQVRKRTSIILLVFFICLIILSEILPEDIECLIKEAKSGTELHHLISDQNFPLPHVFLEDSWFHTRIPGTFLVPSYQDSWCIPGTFLVLPTRIPGAFWCIPGAFLVYSWCIPGVFLVPSTRIP